MAQDGAEVVGVDHAAINSLRNFEREIRGDKIARLYPGIIDADGFEVGNTPLIFSGFSFYQLVKYFSGPKEDHYAISHLKQPPQGLRHTCRGFRRRQQWFLLPRSPQHNPD